MSILPLFDGAQSPAPPPAADTRQTFIDNALDRQRREFKIAFKQFAEDYKAAHDRFLAADVIAAYDATNLPKPVKDYRCTGGIFQGMIHKGELRIVGTTKAADGSGRNMDVYTGR